jgi:hypothetical protein
MLHGIVKGLVGFAIRAELCRILDADFLEFPTGELQAL